MAVRLVAGFAAGLFMAGPCVNRAATRTPGPTDNRSRETAHCGGTGWPALADAVACPPAAPLADISAVRVGAPLLTMTASAAVAPKATAVANRQPMRAPPPIAAPLATISAYSPHLDLHGRVCLGPGPCWR